MKTKTRQFFEPRRILVPVDFSASSLGALRQAVAIAQRYDARLVLLHVVEPFHADMHMDTTRIRHAARAAAHERLAEMVAVTKKTCPRTSRKLRAGHPVTTITAFAQRADTDLIVIGTHGRTGLKRGLIGSVAERVVRHAPCPVLVVR